MKKQKIVKYLLITAFILLLTNVALELFIKKDPNIIEPTTLSVSEVNSKFISIVTGLGIDKSWIKSKKLKHKLSDSVSSVYEVKTPASLPIAVIISELNSALIQQNLIITSRELVKRKVATLKILSDKTIMLQADIVSDTLIHRNTVALGFIIYDTQSLSDKQIDEIRAQPEYLAFILTPSNRGESLIERITDSRKEYVVLLNDDIDNVKFKLKPSYNKSRLIKSVRTIFGGFRESKLFLIDETSNLHKSPADSIVSKEFAVRRHNLVPLSNFVTIRSQKDKDIQSVFKSCCESGDSTGNKVFLISGEDFCKVSNEIHNLRKKGFQFVPPSALKFGLK
ncbi:MAG: hypothetical protein WCJ01_10045 [Ignavibacteria bacterium]